jgi:hypothetical protein
VRRPGVPLISHSALSRTIGPRVDLAGCVSSGRQSDVGSFDDLQRVETVGRQRVQPAKTSRSMLEKAKRLGDLRRSTFSW